MNKRTMILILALSILVGVVFGLVLSYAIDSADWAQSGTFTPTKG